MYWISYNKTSIIYSHFIILFYKKIDFIYSLIILETIILNSMAAGGISNFSISALYDAEPGIPRSADEKSIPGSTAEQGIPRSAAEQGIPRSAAEPGIPWSTAEQGIPRSAAEPGIPRSAAEPGISALSAVFSHLRMPKLAEAMSYAPNSSVTGVHVPFGKKSQSALSNTRADDSCVLQKQIEYARLVGENKSLRQDIAKALDDIWRLQQKDLRTQEEFAQYRACLSSSLKDIQRLEEQVQKLLEQSKQ